MKWVAMLVATVGVLGWGLSTLDPTGQRDPGLFGFGAEEVPQNETGTYIPIEDTGGLGAERRCSATQSDYPRLMATAAGRLGETDREKADALDFLQIVFPGYLLDGAPPELTGDLAILVAGVADVSDGTLEEVDEARYAEAYARFVQAMAYRC